MSSERRLHPYSIAFAFLTQIRLFIVPGIFVYLGAQRSEGNWWQPWMMFFILPNAAFAVLRYLTYRYRYDDSELVIRSGLLFRRERHIPYARIQNIDAVQNVLHRLLTVVDVRIETGGGATAEATMSVLPMSALTEMRERVFADRHPVATDQEEQPEKIATAARPLLRLNTRELLLGGFIENRGAVLIAAAFGVIWELGLFDRIVTPLVGEPITGRGVLRNFVRGVISNATISWGRIALTIAAFLGLLLLIRLFSMAWAVVRLHGFTLTLVDDDARSQFGLLTRVAQTIPLRRIQALSVREGPLHRYFGRVAVRVSTAGGRLEEQSANADREYVAPILRREALGGFVQAMIGVAIAETAWNPPHPRAFRREVKGWLVTAAIICVVAAGYLRWDVLPVIPMVLLWAVIGARQTVKHLGWAETGEAILFKSGWLWRRIVVVRLAKIQTVTLYHSPFDRRTAMARVHVDTAGVSEGSAINIPYIAWEAAVTLYLRLSSEAAQRQFKW
ncbi:MAG TPA: PH domain-containing protein [Vicinamibacterales bacterium]|nr:PH domain-containing protein [Vicinamibacterales bacterium]